MEPLHLGVTGLGIVATIVGLYVRLVKPRLDQAIDDAVDTAKWRTATDARLHSLEEDRQHIREGIAGLNLAIQESARQSTQEHAQMREFVHGEIRRVEEKITERHKTLYDKVDRLRDHITDCKITKKKGER